MSHRSKGAFSTEQLVILVVAVVAVLLMMSVVDGTVTEIFKKAIQPKLN